MEGKRSDRVDFTFENVPVPIHATSLFELYPGEKVEEDYRMEYALLKSEERFGDAVVEEEVHRVVMEEIDGLPQEQRRVILLHLEGKNNIEIAEVMEVSVNTVKTHKARARQQLKTKLQDLFVITFILGL